MAAASRLDVAGYLERLGLPDQGEPSVDSLRRLHRAHAVESAERRVLGALRYCVTRHVGGVQRTLDGPAGATAGHMALTVAGLPDESCPDGVWMVDVGLGAALHEPIPLREGTYRQGQLEFGLRPSDAVAGGWRLDNDVKGSFVGMDFRSQPADISDFAEMHHQYLSTAAESGFVRVSVVQRRDSAGADVLRGIALGRLGADSAPGTLLRSPAEWFEALADLFGLTLEDVDASERARLWMRVLTAHEEYERSLST